jgi:hypothetical protein
LLRTKEFVIKLPLLLVSRRVFLRRGFDSHACVAIIVLAEPAQTRARRGRHELVHIAELARVDLC